MAARRTIDLLPEIFRTQTNKQFLSATLDQLTQEPILKKTQGFVGRRVGPGVNPADSYVTEPTADRTDYQLEPGVVFFKPDTNTAEDAITYPGIIDALNLLGADTTRQDRLFQSEYYAWDPFCDLDKFVNYSQYYWLPQGPDSVDISTADIPLTDSFDVTRTAQGYQFTGIAGDDPVIPLVRGGTYTFNVQQTGNPFWIQAAPGTSGTIPTAPNISSRDVLGVTNNGEDLGTITFDVPLKDAQDFYYTLPLIPAVPGRPVSQTGRVDLITDLKFNQINNIYVEQFLTQYPNGVDGITNLDGRTIVFTNRIEDAQDGGWQITSQFDPLVRDPGNNGAPGSYDSTLFDQTIDITLQSQRYSVWQIQYIEDTQGQFFMRLEPVLSVANLSKFTIQFGTQWASTQWYKNAEGYFEKIPLLTAILDTLYYQDATDPNLFGRFQLLEPDQVEPIRIDDIIGAKNYTSPNGVIFTNGLKVQLRGLTDPPQFQNLEYYVEGVGTGPGIDARVGFVDGEAYYGPWHYYQGRKMTGEVHSEDYFQQYIYDTWAESDANRGAGGPDGAPLPTNGFLSATTGNGIKLLPVSTFVTPETYTKSDTVPYDLTPYDATPYDESLNSPQVPDYLTINRASKDLNAWTRSNRWFHESVIRASAEYNETDAVLDNDLRAKRPIIEFRNNLSLFNFGSQGKPPVNIIDFQETDALSNINGQIGYSIDGYSFINGTHAIFAADVDPEVRNRIYRVEFIDPDGLTASPKIINLVPVDQGEALPGQTVVCLSGNTLQGKSFWFDGSNWILAQQKTNVNQAPLFDVYDVNGYSLANQVVYPSSTFAGSKLFGYALGGTQVTDTILGFSLKFLNISNVGDIVFENYFYTDEFLYVRDNISQTEPISQGFARQYIDRVDFSPLIGWLPSAAENRSRQVFRFVYNGSPLILDVPVDTASVFAPLQIFVGTEFIEPNQYTYTTTSDSTIITLTQPPSEGTVIEVQVISNVASVVGYYQVPLNLENNPINEDSDSFTLGTIRNHYLTIGENLRNIAGPIIGPNNTRDLGNILVYGNNIVQHSSPLALSGTFLRRQQFEAISAIEFNSREYQKYKALLLDLAGKGDFVNNTPTEILDSVITEITTGKNDVSPFYWGDMLPAGQNYTETLYTVSPITTNVFDTVYSYNYTSSNFQGMNVYLNGVILTRGYDYLVTVDTSTITLSVDLVIGDVITIREFQTTYGTYVPNTPSKMGLYPKYRPEIFEDLSYLEPTRVIRGHDGSITVAFGDFRDEVLLEFETRIFNNIKIVSELPITADEVIPGQFRTTNYSLNEINNILAPDFLSWIGWNKLDYNTQTYINGDSFTYNYSQSENKLNRQPLLGAWRGIYDYFYDTVFPTTRPWEMLGFSEQPTWWEDYYGPAPYTSGNLVLWDDLAAGLVRDPAGPYVLPRYRRPDLPTVIPAGDEGELLPPIDTVTGNFDSTSFRRSWNFGDNGPVEYVWRASSAYPFTIMRLLALTKPAKFFSLFADRDRYVFNEDLGQYVWDDRYRLDAKNLAPLYGDGTSKASYINWIIDYNRQLGVNSSSRLAKTLSNIGVRLCWRTAGFTDKRLLKIYTESSTPNSLNTSLLLPDESYQILLYKNQPFEQGTFSSVIIQSTADGYQVLGYSSVRPYFNILTSKVNGNFTVIEAGGQTARLNLDHSDNLTQVPYGYVFTNKTAVCDFLYSYGKYLEQQGFVFDSRENGIIMNWLQMAQEFLYWSNQGWGTGSIINLNPGATKVSITKPLAVADGLNTLRPENLILNQNRQPLPASDLVIERLDNTFTATSLTSNTINYLNLSFTAFEHLVILDNTSIFADLIYDPKTGARQNRVLVSGTLSGEWNGTVNAPGFVLNQDNIQEWQANIQYSKGEIVLFKNEYWSASAIIQPSQEFNYALWIKSDYDELQRGLLPNAATDSDQLANSYSVYDANLEEEVDLFSYGLIGFRPREYMQALNLDDVSQVNLYQQFLGTKGTRRSAELFTYADLGKETAQYDIYEYWSILRDSYGATANRNYVELLLNAALLKSDPSLIQVINPQEQSLADQTVLLQNVWKSSEKLTSPDIFPTKLLPVSDVVLPTAGYVNVNDVNYTAFSFDELSTVTPSGDTTLNEFARGQTVWVAKDNAYDWNVYRIETVPGTIVSVTDNLNGRAVVSFSKQHQLAVDDVLIISFFDPAIDGAYRVLSIPSLDQVTIELEFLGAQDTVIGSGVGFTLQSSRIAQASDAINLPYVNLLTGGSKIWVDDNGTGRWTVLEKQSPFVAENNLPLSEVQPATLFGTSITQGFNNLAAMIGAPGAGNSGAVVTYVKTDTNNYAENLTLVLETTGTAGFGKSMDMGNQTWAVVGAPDSNSDYGYALVIENPPTSNAFAKYQLLVRESGEVANPTEEFGYSTVISNDERWMYVGAPGGNRVYMYGRVDIPQEEASYTTDGVTTSFSYSNVVKVNDSSELVVVLNNQLLVENTDYIVGSTNIFFATAPNKGQSLVITRRLGSLLEGDGSTLVFSVDNIYGITDIHGFAVYIDEVIQRPKFDYDFDAMTSDITFVSAPGNGSSIRIRAGTYWRPVSTLTVAGLASDARFGHSVATTSDGRQLIVGTPGHNNSRGRVYIFDRSVETFQITDATDLSYTTVRSLSSPGTPINVSVNGVFLTNSANATNGQFSISGNTVTLVESPAVGDLLTVDTNQLELIQYIDDIDPEDGQQYGYTVDQCLSNCSLYTGAPFDSSVLPQAGHVQFNINQSRIYGSATSTIANATLTSGDYLRINDRFVELSSINAWNGALSYIIGTFVSNSGNIFRSRIPVPAGTSLTNTTYWEPVNWATVLKKNIDNAAIPNVITSLTADVSLIGNGINKTFDIGTVWSSAESYTPLVYVDNVAQSTPGNYSYDADTNTITFVTVPAYDSVIKVLGARLVISVKNTQSAVPGNKLTVLPGTGTLFNSLGYETFIYVQTIESPVPQDYAQFGKSLFISDNTTALVVGAPNASTIDQTTFDNNTTVFDAGSTTFIDVVEQSGAVYTFDYLPASNPTVTNQGKFVFGQQITNNNYQPLDQFGTAVNYTTGLLLIGAPGADLGDSAANYGQVAQFRNPGKVPAWTPIRLQVPVVDIDLINTVFMYDRFETSVKQYFDYFDPLQGKLLGAVRQNIDYIGAVDPAAYNVGTLNNYGQRWSQERVGQIWWDTINTRFIDPNQDDIVYASRRWGQLFPGSSIDVYQWVASSVPPAQYAGSGTVKDVNSYSVSSLVNEQGVFETTYYYWVKNVNSVAKSAKKTLSAETVARYIENPKSSGISYIAPVDASTVAIYNGLPYISAQDTVIHVEYDREVNDTLVHVEYQLIPEDRADGFLSPALYKKLQDSFCGVDSVGNLVPDPFLPPSELYGVEFRPRQSMFVNRFLALENYLNQANTVMAQFPIAETRTFPLLNSSEPEPAINSGAWNLRLENIEELEFQVLAPVPLGYKYLVARDSTNNGLWTIYEVIAGPTIGSKVLQLIRVQNYDTRLYWSYVNWYRPGFNPLSVIATEVANYSDLLRLTLPDGAIVKVTSNAQGKFEIYQLESGVWNRVALQDGTIAIDETIWNYSIGRFGFDVEVFDAQYFDQEPVIETRKIVQAINEEIFVDDLAIERNRLLILMFNYILSEQEAPEWLTKTSLIDVDHVVRTLEPFQIYRQDNQDFVLNYIQEVKPYHTQIRQFNLIYRGNDTYLGSMTDFDLPAYWDSAQNLFVSPVLDFDLENPLSTTSSVPPTDPLWQTFPYDQWYQNYLLSINSFNLVDGGSGYTIPPQVVITGDAVVPAQAEARINSAGQVVDIVVIDPGQGYSVTPIVTLEGGNGSGAIAVPVMTNDLVRSFDVTIKYDRFQYQSTIVDWEANVNYDNGTLVRYDNRVWEANSDDSTAVQSEIFDPQQWTVVNAGTYQYPGSPQATGLTGVDRTWGLYIADVNEPGLDLGLLINGITYPGVQVDAPDFNENTGFDVGNYDINPFDNISYGPEGRPTYDPAILDTIYESFFGTPATGPIPTGTAATDINVDGGGFVDVYSSHAPEELVPGAIFDTLDFRVYTRPGSDWPNDGHGFDTYGYSLEVTELPMTYDFGVWYEYVPYLVSGALINRTTGVQLYNGVNFTVNWPAKTFTVTSGVSVGDVLFGTAYGVGGGNQLYRQVYLGSDIGNTVTVPVKFSEIQEIDVWVNGQPYSSVTFVAGPNSTTVVNFGTTFTSSQVVTLYVLGPTVINGTTEDYSWSSPTTQYFTANGTDLAFVLTNSLQGTNPSNLIVEINGVRAQPAQGVLYIADGSSLQYYLPTRGGYSQALISDNEVEVYIDNVPQILGVDFLVDPYTAGFDRTITLTNLPPVGSQVLISVDTGADYYLNGNTLIWRLGSSLIPNAGDTVAVTTWNDTSQQNLLTSVFVGPTTSGVQISEGYDSTDYDVGNVTNDPGSFDYGAGTIVETNQFDIGRIVTNVNRLIVSLNGFYLSANTDYTVEGTTVILAGPAIGASAVVAITSFTESVVPEAIAFRIFQDMRGIQLDYRITEATTTSTTQWVSADADVIYVDDASKLSEPNLPAGLFGLVTIDGERISYRARNTTNNTISGLRRGTAGTGASEHGPGSAVYDIGLGNLIPTEYQNRVLKADILANGTQTVFTADDINLYFGTSTDSVEVYVGGILQSGGYTVTGIAPVTVQFTQAPTDGYQVTIAVAQGLSWYEPGSGTASDGIALQEQQTLAGRFIRGIS